MPKIITQIALGLWSIAPGNYSAITPVEDGVYAIVDDKDPVDGYKLLTLQIDSVKGKLIRASIHEPEGMTQRRADGVGTRRDCEGACYYPARGTVFVSGEAHQDILEYDREGNPTGRHLAVPECMSRTKIANNLGFEALSYNAQQHRFWTTTESMLPADGSLLPTIDATQYNPLHPLQTTPPSHPEQADAHHPHPAAAHMLHDGQEIIIEHEEIPASEAPVRTTEHDPEHRLNIRLLSFNERLQPDRSYIYTIDPPTTGRRKGNGVHGVASILALDNGKLLVLEREGFCPKWKLGAFVNHKIYVVDPRQEQPVSLDTPMSEVQPDQIVHKQLLVEFKTRLSLFRRTLANYEGICLGPRLTDGRQTLLLIADSQNGMGNFLFHLKDYIGIYPIADEHLLTD